jgi:hypothetical protein
MIDRKKYLGFTIRTPIIVVEDALQEAGREREALRNEFLVDNRWLSREARLDARELEIIETALQKRLAQNQIAKARRYKDSEHLRIREREKLNRFQKHLEVQIIKEAIQAGKIISTKERVAKIQTKETKQYLSDIAQADNTIQQMTADTQKYGTIDFNTIARIKKEEAIKKDADILSGLQQSAGYDKDADNIVAKDIIVKDNYADDEESVIETSDFIWRSAGPSVSNIKPEDLIKDVKNEETE